MAKVWLEFEYFPLGNYYLLVSVFVITLQSTDVNSADKQ